MVKCWSEFPGAGEDVSDQLPQLFIGVVHHRLDYAAIEKVLCQVFDAELWRLFGEFKSLLYDFELFLIQSLNDRKVLRIATEKVLCLIKLDVVLVVSLYIFCRKLAKLLSLLIEFFAQQVNFLFNSCLLFHLLAPIAALLLNYLLCWLQLLPQLYFLQLIFLYSCCGILYLLFDLLERRIYCLNLFVINL